MQDSLYSALFGAMTAEHKLDLIANNLANVNTTGYKRERVSFRDTFARMPSDYAPDARANLRADRLFPDPRLMARVRMSEVRLDMSQGSMRQTGNPLDCAIHGDGLFKVKTPEGDRFTRNGNFFIGSEGRLVTAQGFEVLGDGGPINVPPNAKVQIDSAGRVLAEGNEVGTIGVYTVPDPSKDLDKLGRNLFQAKSGVQETAVQSPTVASGFLETANVEIVEEMVKMIEVNRGFEAYQKIITTTQEIDGKAIREVGSGR